jgi:hypothetical protein
MQHSGNAALSQTLMALTLISVPTQDTPRATKSFKGEP